MSPKLSELHTLLPTSQLLGEDAEFIDLTLDSREVHPGWMFCATKGSKYDGHSFIEEAIQNGASALMVSQRVNAPLPQLIVPSVRHALGKVSDFTNAHPSQKLNLIGVTGTNGKTTTSYLIESILKASGHSTGLIGTIEAKYKDSRHPSIHTTPEAPDLHRYLKEMVAEGIDSVVMEVSSHGIDQHRVDSAHFSVALFTNLTAEHLDYHGTIEQYYWAKSQLFLNSRSDIGIICIDDLWGERLAQQIDIPKVTFGYHPDADVRIVDVKVTPDGTDLRLKGMGYDTSLHVQIVGACNAQNAAAAYIAGRTLGASEDEAKVGIESCTGVSGRFQQVELGQDFLVVVDYAHTPDSIRALIQTVRDIIGSTGKVTLVAGARGRRDRIKRPELGRAAATADLAILTTDNPGDEDPSNIVEQLVAGTFDIPQKHIEIELDRSLAIKRAIDGSEKGDAVLIVGRGHESFFRVGNNQIHLDDRQEAERAIIARLSRTGKGTVTVEQS